MVMRRTKQLKGVHITCQTDDLTCKASLVGAAKGVSITISFKLVQGLSPSGADAEADGIVPP